ncbi:Uncharacterised protein [Mycobacterium tuberculosis]|nr:Uncharacterised protein [Mycobacterium tuberculosis]COV40450.1 Uncharacterised protein [Mycobacterium tuberculosis]COW46077.1 Uncharacterised protein [Mycobacterium tuberculosis]SGO89745.1 Uncharacterised protein [Mycobacterium tuberculosis]
MAASTPSAGGPDSSTAPPGSTLTTLPPGSGLSHSRTSVISSQLGRRNGSAGSKQCASISRPTRPNGPSTRQPSAMYSAAADESVISTSSGAALSSCEAAAVMAASVISRSLRARRMPKTCPADRWLRSYQNDSRHRFILPTAPPRE